VQAAPEREPPQRWTEDAAGLQEEAENLAAACAVFLAFYNFCWRTRGVVEGRTRLPAAMAAGVTGSLMGFEQLFDAVMGGGYAIASLATWFGHRDSCQRNWAHSPSNTLPGHCTIVLHMWKKAVA
jgi:hypothetical protein